MNCNAQVFLNVAQFGMGMQKAIAQPRDDHRGQTFSLMRRAVARSAAQACLCWATATMSISTRMRGLAKPSTMSPVPTG